MTLSKDIVPRVNVFGFRVVYFFVYPMHKRSGDKWFKYTVQFDIGFFSYSPSKQVVKEELNILNILKLKTLFDIDHKPNNGKSAQ